MRYYLGMNRTVEKTLLWVLRGGLVLILFTPTIYSSAFMFPFIMPRAFFFQVITEILFGIAVAFVVFFPRYRPKWSSLYTAIAAFFAISLLTTLTSADLLKSFMGTIERAFGFFPILHFFLLFFVATVALRTKRQFGILLLISIGISVLVAGSYLIPMLRYGATFKEEVTGNPLFLAGYLLFHFFFAIAIAFHESMILTKNRLFRIALLVVAFFLLSTILATGVRGTFLGLSAGIFFIIVYFAWKHPKLRLSIIGILLLLVSTYVFLYINRKEPGFKNNAIIHRITNFSMQDDTVKARFAMWKMAIGGLKERPIVGWGRENFSLVFNAHYDPSFEKAKVAESWEDRGHNVIFDELTNGGILMLTAYLFLLFTVFWKVRQHPLLLALVIAYVVQNLVGVDTINTYLPFFLFLGLLHTPEQEENRENRLLAWRLRIPILGLTLLFITAGITLSIIAAQGNRMMLKAMAYILSTTPDPQIFKSYYAKGKELLKYFPAMRAEAATTLSTAIFQQGPFLAQHPASFFLFATPIMEDLGPLFQRNPLEQRFGFILGKLYLISGSVSGDLAYFDRVEKLWTTMLSRAPERALFLQSVRETIQLKTLVIEEIKKKAAP